MYPVTMLQRLLEKPTTCPGTVGMTEQKKGKTNAKICSQGDDIKV